MSLILTLRSLGRASFDLSWRVTASGTRKLHSTIRRPEQYHRANIETFTKVINAKDRIALVDFYADWCRPCHQLSPILEGLTSDPDTKTGSGYPIDLVKVNTEDDDGLTLGQKFKIRALPTVIAFRDGEPVDQFVGALDKPGVQRFLQSV